MVQTYTNTFCYQTTGTGKGRKAINTRATRIPCLILKFSLLSNRMGAVLLKTTPKNTEHIYLGHFF